MLSYRLVVAFICVDDDRARRLWRTFTKPSFQGVNLALELGDTIVCRRLLNAAGA